MVLVQSAPRSRSFHIHPNPARIAGAAIAIVLNAAVLFAMTLFMRSPLAMPEIERFPIRWVLAEEKQDPPPPPPVVPVTTPQQTAPTPVQPQTVTPPVDPVPIVVDDAGPLDTPYVPPTQTMQPNPGPSAAPGPVAGVRLEYAAAPAPSYPRDELIGGIEGTVLLQVLVDVDGSPLEVSIHTSSGNRRLDRAAQQQVLRKWKFRPAMRDGRPIQAVGLVPIDFKLK